MDLFTEAEKVLLSKYNVDYRFAPKEDLLENFNDKNLETIFEKSNKNVITKSNVLAPFNSSLKRTTFRFEEELKVENMLLRFQPQAKEANRQYELNNNGEIDNGMLINQEGTKKGKKKLASEPLSPKFGFKFKKITGMNSPVGEMIRNKPVEKEQVKQSNTSCIGP